MPPKAVVPILPIGGASQAPVAPSSSANSAAAAPSRKASTSKSSPPPADDSSSSSEDEDISLIPKSRAPRTLSKHAQRLRELLHEGQMKTEVVWFDEEITKIGKQTSRKLVKVDGPDAPALESGRESGRDSSSFGGGKGDEGPAILRRRSSITVSTPIFSRQQSDAEKEFEKIKELADRIADRDEKRRLSVVSKSERDLSRDDPEYAASHRRSILLLSPNEVERSVPVAVRGPVDLRTKKAAVTMFRTIPGLDRPTDEDTYEECVDNVYELITVVSTSKEWKCSATIGKKISPEGKISAEYCNTTNPGTGKAADVCRVCFRPKPLMRPFYKQLRLLSAGMKVRRKELLANVVAADRDQTRFEKDLELAHFKMANVARRRAELESELLLFNQRCSLAARLQPHGRLFKEIEAIMGDPASRQTFVNFLFAISTGEDVEDISMTVFRGPRSPIPPPDLRGLQYLFQVSLMENYIKLSPPATNPPESLATPPTTSATATGAATTPTSTSTPSSRPSKSVSKAATSVPTANDEPPPLSLYVDMSLARAVYEQLTSRAVSIPNLTTSENSVHYKLLSEDVHHDLDVYFALHDDKLFAPRDLFDNALKDLIRNLGNELLPRFKKSTFFRPMLEYMRANREVVENCVGQSKRDLDKSGTEYEVDAQGQAHAVANFDEMMDTDLIQPGVWQRVKVTTLLPVLENYYHWNNLMLKELRGELCIIVQCVYELAAPHCQRIVRSFKARRSYPTMKLSIVKLARFAALLEIQRFARGFLKRRYFLQRHAAVHKNAARTIQCYIRRKLAYLRVGRIREVLRIRWANLCATRIQCMVRRFFARRTVVMRRKELHLRRNQSTHAWGVVTIQKFARGYIARQIVVQRKIEFKLHNRLTKLADRYMTKGDLWAFLKSVDDDYRRYEKTIDEILVREDEMATTFVGKVLTKREQENETAWSRYEVAVEEWKTKKETNPKKYSQKVAENKKKNQNVVAAIVPRDARDENGLADVVPFGTALGGVPGAALRRAVSASAETLAVRLTEVGIHVPKEFGTYGVDPRTPDLRKASLAANRHLGAVDDIRGDPEDRHFFSGRDTPQQQQGRRNLASNGSSRGRTKSGSSRPQSTHSRGGEGAEAGISRNRSRRSRSKETSPSRVTTGASRDGMSLASQGSNASLDGSLSLDGERESPSRSPSMSGRTKGARGLLRTSSAEAGHGRLSPSNAEMKRRSSVSFSADDEPPRVQSALSARVLVSRERVASASPPPSRSPVNLPFPVSPVGGVSLRGPFPAFSGVTNYPPTRSKSRPSTVSSQIEDSIADGDRGWEVEWMREMERRGTTEENGNKFPGTSLHRDLPLGLKDTVERLIKASALRSFIPLMMKPGVTNPYEAFDLYLSLPPSLAKIRHEQEAFGSCMKYVDQLRSMGFLAIEQMLPLSRMVALFKALEPPMPADLIACTRAIVSQLKQRASSEILGGARIKKQFADLKEGKASLQQRMHNFDPAAATEAMNGDDSVSGSSSHPDFSRAPSRSGGVATPAAADSTNRASRAGGSRAGTAEGGPPKVVLGVRESPIPVEGAAKLETKATATSKNAVGTALDFEVESEPPFPPTFEDVNFHTFDGPPDTPRQLEMQLLEGVEGWGSVDDPIDNFITQAAFYIVPYMPMVAGLGAKGAFKPPPAVVVVGISGEDGGAASLRPAGTNNDVDSSATAGGSPNKSANNAPAVATKMGPTAFSVFCKELVQLNKVEPSKAKELMRRRTQQSMIFATPYVTRLKDSGIVVVRDLMRVIFEEWGMPPPLANRCYAMLGGLIANNNALEAGGMYAHTNALASKLPGLYGKGGGDMSVMTSSSALNPATKTREPFDPRFQRSAYDPYGRPPRLGMLLPIIHPPGMEKKGFTWDDDRRTWEQKQKEEDEDSLPGGLFSGKAQYDGADNKLMSALGVDGVARDPIAGNPYKTNRTVMDVHTEVERDARERAQFFGGGGQAAANRAGGEEVDEERRRGGGPVGGGYDADMPFPPIMMVPSGAGDGSEEVYRSVDVQDSVFEEAPVKNHTLGFNGLFSKTNRLVVSRGGDEKESNRGEGEKMSRGSTDGVKRSIRGFGTKSTLQRPTVPENRRNGDDGYRSWVAPYTEKLVDKSQKQFGEYFQYRRQQQVFLDPPARLMETLSPEQMTAQHATELYVGGLPGGVSRDLAMLKLKAKEIGKKLEEKRRAEEEELGRRRVGGEEEKKEDRGAAEKLGILLPVGGWVPGGAFGGGGEAVSALVAEQTFLEDSETVKMKLAYEMEQLSNKFKDFGKVGNDEGGSSKNQSKKKKKGRELSRTT